MKRIRITWRDGAYYVSEPEWSGGDVVMASDHAAAVRELCEALEGQTEFLRHAEWDSHSTEAHVGNLVEQARAALAKWGEK